PPNRNTELHPGRPGTRSTVVRSRVCRRRATPRVRPHGDRPATAAIQRSNEPRTVSTVSRARRLHGLCNPVAKDANALQFDFYNVSRFHRFGRSWSTREDDVTW